MPPRKKQPTVVYENAEAYALLEQKVIAFLLLGHYQQAIGFGFGVDLLQYDYSKKIVAVIQEHIYSAPNYSFEDILPQVKQVFETEVVVAESIFKNVVEMSAEYEAHSSFVENDIKSAINNLREYCARNDIGLISKKIEAMLTEGYDSEYIQSKIREMLDDNADKYAVCAFDDLETLTINLDADNERRDKGIGVIYSGFPDIDRAVNGFNYGEITTVAGETSFGKSALAIKLAHSMSFSDSVGYITFEMPQPDIIRRFYSIDLQIPIRELQTNKSNYVRQILDRKEFNQRRFFCTKGEHATLATMENIIRQMVLNKGIRIIFIDHLHCIETGFQKRESEAITLVMRRLKMLAVGLDIHIFLLAQLNRSMSQREDKRPMLTDLKESSSIEQYSAEVILLHRPQRAKLNKSYYALESADSEEKRAKAQKSVDDMLGQMQGGEQCELILAKNRNGFLTRQIAYFYSARAEFLPNKQDVAEQIFVFEGGDKNKQDNIKNKDTIEVVSI